jgi:hypothetical protein
MLERLRCGIIITDAFVEWIEEWRKREGSENFGLIAELSFVRCGEGERAGESWVSLIWRPLEGVEEHEIYRIGTVRVFFARQTRRALLDRCLDIHENRIMVF